MKRFAAITLLILFLLPEPVCAAAEDFYGEYVPKSERSSLFYIDVYCTREVTAAVFEVRFDDEAVSYYSVSAESASASVRDNPQGGKVSVALASSSAVSGKLCRLSFKALKAGSTDFVLHMEQAADANKNLLSQWSDSALTIKLGKDDIVSDGAVSHSASASKSSLTAKNGGADGADGEEEDAEDDPSAYEVKDLRRDGGAMKWVLIGAGVTALFVALIWLGVIIGKRSGKPKQKEEKPGEETPEPEDITEDEA